MKKIIFTGGHHNSALVIAKNLAHKGHKIYWFGHKHTMPGEKSLSLEYLEVKKEGFPFIEIKTGKFYRTYNPWQYVKIIYGFIQSFYELLKIKPDIIVSFGGYLSVPVVIIGYWLKIKTVIHEQTTRAGLANLFLKKWAGKVLLGWESSRKFFPKEKTHFVGMPLDLKVFEVRKPVSPFPDKLPTILITGGKQGSHVINTIIEQNLAKFLGKYNLIHQTGAIIKTDDFARLSQKRQQFSERMKNRYLIKKFFYGEEMVKMVKLADVVISRSGAHIIHELAVLGKPAVFIPLPWAHHQEQLTNAKMLEEAGLAVIIVQNELTGPVLWRKVQFVLKNLLAFRKKGLSFSRKLKKDSAKTMVKIIEKELSSKKLNGF